MKSRLFLTFPQRILGEPLLYTLGKEFSVVPNIQGASITKDRGLMALELTGEESEIHRAISFMQGKGVTVEVMPEDRDVELR